MTTPNTDITGETAEADTDVDDASDPADRGRSIGAAPPSDAPTGQTRKDSKRRKRSTGMKRGAAGSSNPFLEDITAQLAARLAARGEELHIADDATQTGGPESLTGDAASTTDRTTNPTGTTAAPTDSAHRVDAAGAAGSLVSLLASIADLADAEPATLTSAQRCHLATVLADAHGRLDALSATATGAIATHHDHLATGTKSPAGWLAARSELSQQQASSHIRLHRDLQPYPALLHAWRHGHLGTAKIRLLLKASKNVEARLVHDQNFLIDLLEPLTVDHAATAIKRWQEKALGELDASPDDPEPEPVDNSLTTKTGANREQIVSATFDRRTGHEFNRLLQAEIDKAFNTGDYKADDGLSHTARKADALLRLMRRGLETKTEFGRLRPSTVNIVDLAALLGLAPDQVSEVCLRPRETEDGTILSTYELLDDLTHGNLTNILGFYGIHGRFHPIGTITTNRLPDAAQRRLVQIRDNGCMHPGCSTPAHRCVPHHEPPYEKTGHTTVDELVLLCHHHHKLRHQNNTEYHLDSNGDLTTTTAGRTHPPTRPGRKLVTPTPPEATPPPDPPPDRKRTRPRARPTARAGPPGRIRPNPIRQQQPT